MNKFKSEINKYAVFCVLLILYIFFSLTVKNFFTFNNLMNLIIQSTVLGIIGFGLTIIMMSGEIDISFAGSIPLVGSVFAIILTHNGSLLLSTSVALILGVLIGLVNALIITKLKLSSFISTLAMMFLLQGIWQVFTDGNSIWLKDALDRDLIFGNFGPIPRIVVIFSVVFILVFFLTERTRFGIHLRAVGQDADAARTAGINPNLIKTLAFSIGGFIFIFGALISIVRLSGAIATAGNDLMLPVMTVAFVGQTVLGMGRPNIPGTLIGALLMGMITNAFVLMNLPIWSVPIANGLILMIAIALSNIGNRSIIQVKL